MTLLITSETLRRVLLPLSVAVSGLFLVCYGAFRFAVEFVREPDAHLGFVMFDWMTRGQQLSLPMFLAGLGLMLYAYRDRIGRSIFK